MPVQFKHLTLYEGNKYQRVKVFTEPDIIETCVYPSNCKNGFGNANPDDLLCWGNICTEVCRKVRDFGLRWEYA